MEDIGSNYGLSSMDYTKHGRWVPTVCYCTSIRRRRRKEADSMVRNSQFSASVIASSIIMPHRPSTDIYACDSIYMCRECHDRCSNGCLMDGPAPTNINRICGRWFVQLPKPWWCSIVESGDTVLCGTRSEVAEAMVDERVVIPGMVDSTQVLTITAWSYQSGYCEGLPIMWTRSHALFVYES